jgi:hypothetical protein
MPQLRKTRRSRAITWSEVEEIANTLASDLRQFNAALRKQLPRASNLCTKIHHNRKHSVRRVG